jgi:hypothetical protein
MAKSVRLWLGLETLYAGQLAIESKVSRIDASIKDIEAKDVTRHEELLGAIKQLTTVLQNAHATEPQSFDAPVLDWDTVQALALASLEREDTK